MIRTPALASAVVAVALLAGCEQVFEGEITVTLTGLDASMVAGDVWLDGVVGYRVDVGGGTFEVGGVDEFDWYDDYEEGFRRESFYVAIDPYAGPGSYPAVVEASDSVEVTDSEFGGTDGARVSLTGDTTQCTAEVGEDELLGGVECAGLTVLSTSTGEIESDESFEDIGLRATWAGGYVPAASADPGRSDTSAPQ